MGEKRILEIGIWGVAFWLRQWMKLSWTEELDDDDDDDIGFWSMKMEME